MNDIVIRVENLTKEYRLGVINHGTLQQDIQSWWARLRGKEDPNSLISSGQHSSLLNGNPHMLALNDVSFDVKEGEILGIVGRNGAGKSTLLKILSRVTSQTKGTIKIKGKVASLLEVGTGFHSELTGRENIYLNGAILGMTKKEINSKFDEIVAFAEIEKFIDTPVKRYSSGMYVRLAFAVAAHLEPEILIVDEVLAVGDVAFQKKCLGKMGEVAKGGRTVLFVSHNMGAVNQLCTRAVLLKNGQNVLIGEVDQVVRSYLKSGTQSGRIDKKSSIGTLAPFVDFQEIHINGENNNVCISPFSEINISVVSVCKKNLNLFRTSFSIYKDGIRILTSHDLQKPEPLPSGLFKSETTIPPYFLRPGDYTLSIGGHDGGHLGPAIDWIFAPDIFLFSVSEEWSAYNDFANFGIVNVPHNGNRTVEIKADQT